jgi:hypothetical protein
MATVSGHSFNIGPYGKNVLKSSPLKPVSQFKANMARTIHAMLTYWFQRRRLLNIFPIGSYVKIKSSHGGHLEFLISKQFTSLVQDYPMIIPAKSQFNWLSDF